MSNTNMTNMTSKKVKAPPVQVNIPQYVNPWYKKPYKNPNLVSTQIRINNNVPATYVVKRFKDGSFKFFTYQQNQATSCYYLTGVQTGTTCVSTFYANTA